MAAGVFHYLNIYTYSVLIISTYWLKICMLRRQYRTTNIRRDGFMHADQFDDDQQADQFDDDQQDFFRSRVDRCREIFVQMYSLSNLGFLSLLSLHARIDYWIWKVVQVFVPNELWCSYVCLFAVFISKEVHDYLSFVLREFLVELDNRGVRNILPFSSGWVRFRVMPVCEEFANIRGVASLMLKKSFLKSLACVLLIGIVQSLGPSIVFYITCTLSIIYDIGWPYFLFRLKGYVRLPDEHAELRARITSVAYLMKFPLREVYVGNQRDTIVCRPSRYICLSRQLIQEHDISEVVAAVAHHLMMWSHNLRVYTFLGYQGYKLLVILSYLCVAASDSLFHDLGFDSPVPVGLTVVVFLRLHFTCFEDLTALPYRLIKRYCIFKADYRVTRLDFRGSLEYNQSLRGYLTSGDVSGQQFWPIDSLFSLIFFESPTVAERVEQLEVIEEDVRRRFRRRTRRRET